MQLQEHPKQTEHPNKAFCALCSTEISQNCITDNLNTFCCHGCHAVYQILEAKQELHNFSEHPVFIGAVKSGLISNPYLVKQSLSENATKEESEKLYLEIADMWCPSCAEVIHLMLSQEKGVVSSVVDYATDLASIQFLPRHISKDQIFKLIESFGYKGISLENQEHKIISSNLNLRFMVAAFCSLNVMMFSYPLYASYFDYDPLQYGSLFAWLSFFMSLPVMLFSFTPILSRFLNAFKLGIYGMEALVVLGVLSSFTLSSYELMMGGTKVYFDTLTVIVTFVLLGKMIETKAKFSAKESLFRLNFSIPRRARKQFLDGSTKFVPVKEILKGDVFSVLQGEKIPLDGILIEGSGLVDESFMTGESIPVAKEIGSKIIGGGILQTGTLSVEATSLTQESAMTRVIQMVEASLKSKPRYARAIDPIIKYFVPLVLSLTSLTAFFFLFQGHTETAFIRALSIILISCPCAIGIAVPLAESYLMSGLSKLHIIVRNSGVLAFLGKETVFVFDKTGTITEGKFQVIKGLEFLNKNELTALKSITCKSMHLMSLAISKSIDTETIKLKKIEEITGKGLKAMIGENIFHVGSFDFLRLEGILVEDVFERGATSKVYFAINNKLKTVLFLGDSIKKDAIEAIYALKPAKTILLSGDSKEVVIAVSKACSFDEYYFAHTPLMKKEKIMDLKKQGHIVCMVGDGVNDAPALAESHIGISVFSGSDISTHVSDISLTQDQLLLLLNLRSLGKFGSLILKQNLFWAFFYNVVGIALAVFGLLSPIFATFAMMTSSLIVLYNAKRLTRR